MFWAFSKNSTITKTIKIVITINLITRKYITIALTSRITENKITILWSVLYYNLSFIRNNEVN